MNCHGNNENNEKNKKSQIKHMLMMIFCCGLPMLIVLALPFLKIAGSFKTTLGIITPFLCPLMMIFMIPMMFKNSKH